MGAVCHLAWRQLIGRPGLVWLAIACIAVGMAARGAVASSVAAMEDRIGSEARAMLTADIEVSSPRPFDADVRDALAQALPDNARTTEVCALTAMAATEASALLVEVQAVEAAWPLAGQLRTEPAEAASAWSSTAAVAVVDPDLLVRLRTAIGGTMRLGSAHFRIAGTIVAEPGGSTAAFRFGPRVLVPRAALDGAGLTGDGVRKRHLLLAVLANPDDAMRVVDVVRERLGLRDAQDNDPGSVDGIVRVRSAAEAARSSARSLIRAADLLRLVALVALALGAIGAAIVAVGMMHAQVDDLAVLRVIGASQWRTAGVFMIQTGIVGAVGGVLGTLIGAALSGLIMQQLGLGIAWPHVGDLVSGCVLGVAAAAIAAAIPALRLARMDPLAVLRGEQPAALSLRMRAVVLILTVFSVVVVAGWESRSWTLGPATAAGLIAAAGVLALAASGLSAARRLSMRGGFAVQHGLARLADRAQRPRSLVVALGLAAGLGATLLVLQASLQAELAPGRVTALPSAFAIDIQPDQRVAFTDMLVARGLTPNLRPLVRARLTRIDGAAADGAVAYTTREAETAAQFRRRVQNLTWAAAPGAGERLIRGAWPASGAVCAVEERWAEQLSVDIGSRLAFDVQGVEVTVTIVGIRRVDWWTAQPNFFIVIGPGSLEDAPALWVGTLPAMASEQRIEVIRDLAVAFPNVSLLDIGSAAQTVRQAVDRAAAGVAVVVAVALIAALAVIVGGIAASARTRRGEAALIRVLGGTRHMLIVAIIWEFAIVSTYAVMLGGAIGILGGWLLAVGGIRVTGMVPWWELSIGAMGLIGTAIGVAVLATRPVWRSTPLEALRDGDVRG